MEPGPLESLPYLVKLPWGFAGKRNKNVKMECFSALVQSLCITWENHSKMRPRSFSQGLTILYCDENFCVWLYMLWRLFGIFGFPEVIIFNCVLTPQHSARMQYQVHKFFPYVLECFFAYFSWAKHPAVKANVTRRGISMDCKILLRYAQAHLYTCIHTLYKEPRVAFKCSLCLVPFDIYNI